MIALFNQPAIYVDSVHGNDTHKGTSPGSALRTIAAGVSKITRPRMRLRLARGSHFRETLTVSQNRTTVEAYGAGAAPILDCSDAILTAAWSKTAGKTITYQCSEPHDIAAGKTWITVWENGVRLSYQTTQALVDANPGSYTLSDTTYSPVSPLTIYVSASDGSNPATNGKTYEYARRTFGLDCSGATGCTIRGIQTQRNLHNDGSLILGRSSVARDCVAADGQYHNVFVGAGSKLYNVTAQRAWHPAAIGLFVWNPTGATGEGLYFEGCQALLDAYTAGVGGGFGGHGTGTLGAVTFENCTVQNCDLGFFGGLAASMVLTGCAILGPHSHAIAGDATLTTSLTVSDFSAPGMCSFRFVNQVANNCTLNLADVQAVSSNGACGVFLNGLSGISLTITDSVLDGFQTLSADSCAGFTFAFLRNVLPNCSGFLFWITPESSAIDSDYNSLSVGPFSIRWGEATLTWAEWQGLGNDLHSNTDEGAPV